MFRPIARKVLPARVRRTLKRWLGISSHGYEILENGVPPDLHVGWKAAAVAERQHAAFVPLLQQMYEGRVREDFAALAKAVQMTGLEKPLIIEVGCGSGWNSEILTHLLKGPFRYIGLDYSPAMIDLAKRHYLDVQFVIGEATALPFRDSVCDILVSGTVLMHLLEYRSAIRESRRIARKWCIFHTVPVLIHRPSVFLKKEAYGQPTIEVVLNESELLDLFDRNSLIVRNVIDSLPYDLAAVVGERTVTKTYLCEIRQ
jgi:SAM-dependent methyltransferase